MNIADIVISLNGRDAGKRFIVIAIEDEYALIANGKGRRLEKPKRKKIKHIKYEGKASSGITQKLQTAEKITNSELRREIASEGGVPICQKMT